MSKFGLSLSLKSAKPKTRTYRFTDVELARHNQRVIDDVMPDAIYVCNCMYAVAFLQSLHDELHFSKKRLTEMFEAVQQNFEELLVGKIDLYEARKELLRKNKVNLCVSRNDRCHVDEDNIYESIPALFSGKLRIKGGNYTNRDDLALRYPPQEKAYTAEGKTFFFNDKTLADNDKRVIAGITEDSIYITNWMYSTAMLMAMRDRLKFGRQRMSDIFHKVHDEFNAIATGYINYSDIAEALKDECGLELESVTKFRSMDTNEVFKSMRLSCPMG